MQTSKESSGIDKQGIWGWWHDSLKWKDKLEKQALHKALDIPEENDMQNVGNRYGMGWKEMAVVGLMVLGGYGLATYVPDLLSKESTETTTTTTNVVDAQFTVKFFDKDGNPIDVPHISTMGQKDGKN